MKVKLNQCFFNEKIIVLIKTNDITYEIFVGLA